MKKIIIPVIMCLFFTTPVLAVMRADFPSTSRLQPPAVGVMPNISNNIDNTVQKQASNQGESSADTVISQSPEPNDETTPLNKSTNPSMPESIKDNYYLFAGGIFLIVVLLLAMGWIIITRPWEAKNDIMKK